MHRDFDTFIGVDLGGGKGKNTAVALLQRTAAGVRVVHVSTRAPEGDPFFDKHLLRYLRENGARALLAIDAPLLLSVCLRCRLATCMGLDGCDDPVVRWFRGLPGRPPRGRRGGKPQVTAYTQRACEVWLHDHHGILPRETLGQGMGPLTARAHYLRRALEGRFTLNQNLLEVYPKATVHALFGPLVARRYKREVDTWATRAMILERLGPELQFEVWREGCLKNDHCFDAVICAYTGYLWAKEGWELPEEDREIFELDGWIWFPGALAPPVGE